MFTSKYHRLTEDELREQNGAEIIEAALRALEEDATATLRMTSDNTKHLGKGSFHKGWTLGDMGEKASEQWKEGLMRDWSTWLVPASLLMTVAFTHVFLLSPDVIYTTPLGFGTPELYFRTVVAHLFFFSLISSGLLSLKSINDNSQKILFCTHTPSSLLPAARAFEKHYKDLLEKKHNDKMPLSRRILDALEIKEGAAAYKQSIDLLGVGFTCGLYLLVGASYLLTAALPFAVITSSMRHQGSISFLGPWNAFMDKVKEARDKDAGTKRKSEATTTSEPREKEAASLGV